jgi:hypothetical protein
MSTTIRITQELTEHREQYNIVFKECEQLAKLLQKSGLYHSKELDIHLTDIKKSLTCLDHMIPYWTNPK